MQPSDNSTEITKDILLNPFMINHKLQLKNRIIMAPMTRNMAFDDLTPTPDMASYYARRASAGLIISEGTIIRQDSWGYSHVPGIFTESHIAGWNKVTDAVHTDGGKIFSQIWHVGRVNHPEFLNGELPFGPSATEMTGPVRRSNGLFYGKSRALELNEIKQLIEDFATAAENAMAAGFDGIEIHGANGFLIDQFLHYHTNHREDDYGATPENMARFALEVVNACGNAIGFERVGLRLSPGGHLNEIIGDMRDAGVFEYLLKKLSALSIAYLHTGNFDDSVRFPELNNQSMTEFMRSYYKGTLIANGGYTLDGAAEDINRKEYDLIAIGRQFIANPNLVDKLHKDEPFTEYNADMLKTLI